MTSQKHLKTEISLACSQAEDLYQRLLGALDDPGCDIEKTRKLHLRYANARDRLVELNSQLIELIYSKATA